MKHRSIVMKKIILVIFALLPFLASADLSQGTPLFSFDPPTENTDGSPLNAATELQGYRLYCNGDTSAPVITIPSDASSYQTSPGEIVDGNYICELKSVNLGGVESSGAPLLSFTVLTPPVATVVPNPPMNAIRQ